MPTLETNVTDEVTAPAITYELFIDKYRPLSFDNIRFNSEIAHKMQACARTPEIPHILIKGPSGCGKNTFADLYIQTKYGKDKLKVKQRMLEIKHNNKTIELQLLHSIYHYKIDPSIHGVYDRLIIQGFIKDVLQSKPPASEIPYHMIIIQNAEKLTLEAQQSLRRTLEKYIDNCRFIFIIGQESNLIEPLMSRCLQLRLSAPTEDEITGILETICEGEGITYNCNQLSQIAEYSNRNLNTAINLLQYMSIHNKEILCTDQEIEFSDFVEIDNYLDQIVETIFETTAKKNLKNILAIRTQLYDLLVHCVEPIEILKRLFQKIFQQLRDRVPSATAKAEHELVQALVKYENTLKLGSKPIYHLEGFVVTALNIISGQ
jgi:replication factor C subunit 3/5